MDDVAKKYDAYAYEPSGKLTVDAVIDHLCNVKCHYRLPISGVIVLVGRLHFVRLHYNLGLSSVSPIPSYYTNTPPLNIMP